MNKRRLFPLVALTVALCALLSPSAEASEVRALSGGGRASSGKADARQLEHSFGIVSSALSQPPRLSITGPRLKKGDRFHVVSQDEQKVFEARVVAARRPAADEIIPEGASSYTVQLIPPRSVRIRDEEPFVGLAVVGAGDGLTTSGGTASVQLPNGPAGKRLYFRVCTSSEGMHMTVWSGKPLAGQRVWHGYHYLGYDVEPNCTPRDYPKE